MKLSDLANATKYIPIELTVGESPLKLEIRLPLKAEVEAIRVAYSTPDASKVDDEYKRLSDPVKAVLTQLRASGDDTPSDSLGIKEEDDDTWVRGSDGVQVSLKTVARFNVSTQIKTQLLFALIKREEGEAEPTYDDIVAQLPESVVKAIVAGIEEAIHPSYEVTRKK